MEPKIRCKFCECIWEYSELSERGEDGFFLCPKCNESLAQPHWITTLAEIIPDDRTDPLDDLDKPLSELWIHPLVLDNWEPEPNSMRLITFGQNDADTRLIAAAPDMLDALEAMINIFDRGLPDGTIGRSTCEKAKSAIAKAKGENNG